MVKSKIKTAHHSQPAITKDWAKKCPFVLGHQFIVISALLTSVVYWLLLIIQYLSVSILF